MPSLAASLQVSYWMVFHEAPYRRGTFEKLEQIFAWCEKYNVAVFLACATSQAPSHQIPVLKLIEGCVVTGTSLPRAARIRRSRAGRA